MTWINHTIAPRHADGSCGGGDGGGGGARHDGLGGAAAARRRLWHLFTRDIEMRQVMLKASAVQAEPGLILKSLIVKSTTPDFKV